MRAICLSFSATLVPHNVRCASVCVSFPPPAAVMKNQISPPRRRSFSSYSRIPRFSVMATQSRNAAESPTSVPVSVAYDLLQAGYRYLDVRTSDEFTSGHVDVVSVVNVPFMFKDVTADGTTVWSYNPKFEEEVLTHFSKDDEIIVGCSVGVRSLPASTDLLSAGFTGITNMAGGYDAWVQKGLPTTNSDYNK